MTQTAHRQIPATLSKAGLPPCSLQLDEPLQKLLEAWAKSAQCLNGEGQKGSSRGQAEDAPVLLTLGRLCGSKWSTGGANGATAALGVDDHHVQHSPDGSIRVIKNQVGDDEAVRRRSSVAEDGPVLKAATEAHLAQERGKLSLHRAMGCTGVAAGGLAEDAMGEEGVGAGAGGGGIVEGAGREPQPELKTDPVGSRGKVEAVGGGGGPRCKPRRGTVPAAGLEPEALGSASRPQAELGLSLQLTHEQTEPLAAAAVKGAAGETSSEGGRGGEQLGDSTREE
jgi:hypothetical protein